MAKRFARQYHFDTDVEGIDDKGWSKPEYFDNIDDLYVEVQDLWNCEEFSMELETWCEQANIGDVFEDDDIRVTVVEASDGETLI